MAASTTPSASDVPAWAAVFAPLEREMAAYRRTLPGLLDAGEEGRYALFKGDALVGLWDTQAEALLAGREQFGLEPVCVKRIEARDVARLAQVEAEAIPSETSCRS
jgi:hypothetical protein